MTKPAQSTPVWVEALLDTALSASERMVLMYLCWRQGDNPSAWPAQETIANDLGLTIEGVRKITDRLESKGWLTIERPLRHGRGRHLKYAITLPEKTPTAVGLSAQKKPQRLSRKTPTAVRAKTPVHKEEHYRNTTSTLRRAQKVARVAEYTPDFNRFWLVYPKKVDKFEAFEVWTALNPDPALVEKIIMSVRAYAQTEQWTRSMAEDGGRYIPHATTFLNKHRWEDTPPAKPEPQPGDDDWFPSEEDVDRDLAKGRARA